MKPFDLLVFDWDGTLADSVGLIVAGMQVAIAELNLPPRRDAEVGALIGLGMTDGLGRLYPELDQAWLLRRLAGYRKRAPERTARAPLFAGALAALRSLRADGYRLAVATGKSRAGLDRALAAQPELVALLEDSRCADEAADKPDPAMLLQILAATGVDAARALVIGDTEYDMAMAAAAGVPALGVCSGGHDDARLRRGGALAVIEGVATLPRWLRARQSGGAGITATRPSARRRPPASTSKA